MSGGRVKCRSDLTGDLSSSQNQKVIEAAGGKIVMIDCDLCKATRVVGEVTYNNGVKESDNSRKKIFECFICKDAGFDGHGNWTLNEAISCVQDETCTWVAPPAASNDSTTNDLLSDDDDLDADDDSSSDDDEEVIEEDAKPAAKKKRRIISDSDDESIL